MEKLHLFVDDTALIEKLSQSCKTFSIVVSIKKTNILKKETQIKVTNFRGREEILPSEIRNDFDSRPRLGNMSEQEKLRRPLAD